VVLRSNKACSGSSSSTAAESPFSTVATADPPCRVETDRPNAVMVGPTLPVTLLGRGYRGGAVDNYAVRPGRAKCWVAVPGTWTGFSPTAQPGGSLALGSVTGLQIQPTAHGTRRWFDDAENIWRPDFHDDRKFVWVSFSRLLLLLYSTTTGVEKSDLARADFLVLSVTKDTILDISTYGSCIEYFDF
jgi:hypothetical protein